MLFKMMLVYSRVILNLIILFFQLCVKERSKDPLISHTGPPIFLVELAHISFSLIENNNI